MALPLLLLVAAQFPPAHLLQPGGGACCANGGAVYDRLKGCPQRHWQHEAVGESPPPSSAGGAGASTTRGDARTPSPAAERSPAALPAPAPAPRGAPRTLPVRRQQQRSTGGAQEAAPRPHLLLALFDDMGYNGPLPSTLAWLRWPCGPNPATPNPLS